ncbi:uncharacterized protein LOC18009844 [Eutrema salsugineum]|uniref:uncharacterized protein LOC18009844 n=1 Tax=Eutrema salsugineum TaxID=72664 RepID=UPI000CED5C00|nr:uncharacterized protein LOC18009844 [Eutrema salsugineum]
MATNSSSRKAVQNIHNCFIGLLFVMALGFFCLTILLYLSLDPDSATQRLLPPLPLITYGSEENITEREMEAAQHLMQLSDEEDISLNIITKKKIVALFGKDDIYQDQCTNTKEMVVMRVMPSQRKKKKKETMSDYGEKTCHGRCSQSS